MSNEQKSPRIAEGSNKRIPLVECFGPTIQGEGSVIGQQTYFLRFGLCDYKCRMCDSMHAVDPAQVKQNAKWLTQQQIFEQLQATFKPGSNKCVTFSGGNPCIHDLQELVDLLNMDGWYIVVETQGTKSPDWLKNVDIISVSPKGPGMGENTDFTVLDNFLWRQYDRKFRIYIKIVVFDERDLEFARYVKERYDFAGFLYYLSLGNPHPEGDLPEDHFDALLKQYRIIHSEIATDPILSSVRFLPQWHHFVWANEKGK